MIFAGILAGGTGSRMGFDMPKQFLKIGSKPIIIHTIEKFLIMNCFERIVVAIHPEWVSYFNELLDKYLYNFRPSILITEGGTERNSSIQKLIEKIEEFYEISDEDSIVTHDAVRPFVNVRTLLDNVKGLEQYSAIDTVVSAVDTIVVSEDHKVISSIPVRGNMYQGQTPQSFRITKFKKLYSSLDEHERASLTDACKIFVIKGEQVGIVKGEYSNIKITTVTDLKIAQALLEQEND